MEDEGRKASRMTSTTLKPGWFEDAQESFRQIVEMARTMGIECASKPTKTPPKTPTKTEVVMMMRRKDMLLKTPSPRKAKDAERQMERERHKSEAKKRLLDHRKNLQNVRSTISRSKPSPSFVGHALEPATTESDASFYVSLKGSEVNGASEGSRSRSRPSPAPAPAPAPAPPARRRSQTSSTQRELPSVLSTELSKSLPARKVHQKQRRRSVCLDICDEIAAARQQCLESLGPDLVAHIRSSLTKGVPLKTQLLSPQEHADAVRLVKRLIYLEDAYYG